MTSVTDICNRALGEAGVRSSISSIDENSPSAIQCRRYFESTRDEILQMAWWNFARKYATLSVLKALPGTPENPDGTASDVWLPEFPPPPWLYSYAYPSDCLMARYIVPQNTVSTFSVPLTSAQSGMAAEPHRYTGPAIPFIRATDVDDSDTPINIIATNQRQAVLCYTFRNAVPNTWSALFISALIYGLAGKLSIPLSGKRSLMSDNFILANKYVEQARAQDGNEGLTIIDNTPDWIAIRDGIPAGTWIGPTPNYAPLFGVGSV